MNPADGDHAEAQRERIATGSYGEPQDIAGLVAGLRARKASSSRTSLTIDGGATLNAGTTAIMTMSIIMTPNMCYVCAAHPLSLNRLEPVADRRPASRSGGQRAWRGVRRPQPCGFRAGSLRIVAEGACEMAAQVESCRLSDLRDGPVVRRIAELRVRLQSRRLRL